ncbi:MAG: peptidylprolyl isomerase [bacterium]
MLRKQLTVAWFVALALSVAAFGFAACKKEPKNKGKTGDMAAAMDQTDPPATPVEMAADGMGALDMAAADMAAMDTNDDTDDMAADPTIPTAGQATARMILIGWKDSSVPVEVKRSKDDARKLAEAALADAKRDASEKNFIKLVKKYSDTAKESGGKVGPFGPKEVPAYIAKAVFPLKKNGVSAIVETKAGFHIFMRTK